MTLLQAIRERRGVTVLYWYDGDYMASQICEPVIIDEHTVKLCDEIILGMDRKNLFCLVWEETDTDNIYVINKGYLENEFSGVFLKASEFEMTLNDKRVFYRFEFSKEIMIMGASAHILCDMNNISYSGVNISCDAKFDINESVMMYDPKEDVPVYIPGTIVYFDGARTYGVKITGNYEQINKLITPNIVGY